MNAELKKALQERYSTLLLERDEFMSKANQKLGEYAGRLAELEIILMRLADKDNVQPDKSVPDLQR